MVILVTLEEVGVVGGMDRLVTLTFLFFILQLLLPPC